MSTTSTNELLKRAHEYKIQDATKRVVQNAKRETRHQAEALIPTLEQVGDQANEREKTALRIQARSRSWKYLRTALLVFLTLGFMPLMYYKRNTVLEYLRKILITKNVYLDPETQQDVETFAEVLGAGDNQTFIQQAKEAVQENDAPALVKIVIQAIENRHVPIETFAQTAASDVQRLLPTWKRTIFGIATGVTTGLGGIFVGAKRKWRDFVHPLRAEGIEEIGESGSHPRRIVRVRRQQVQEELNRRHNEHGRHLGTRMMSNQYSSAGIAGRRNVHNTAGTSR